MFDEWSNSDRPEGFMEAHIIVALVDGETAKSACGLQGALQTGPCFIPLFGVAMQVDDCSFSYVNQKCCLDRSHRTAGLLELVGRRLPAVEVGGIDRGVAVGFSNSADRRNS